MKRGERTEITRSRIIAAAVAEFGKNGYEGASLNSVCETGIPKGLLYHNYESRDAVYLACVRKSFEGLLERLRAENAGSDIRRYMDVRLSYFRERPDEANLIVEAMLGRPEKLRREIGELKSEFDGYNLSVFRAILSGMRLREGISEGDAEEYFSLMQQAFNLRFVKSGTDGQKVARHEEMLSKLLDMMLFGIAGRGED